MDRPIGEIVREQFGAGEIELFFEVLQTLVLVERQGLYFVHDSCDGGVVGSVEQGFAGVDCFLVLS